MDLYHERANLLKVLAHPFRLRILDVLRHDAECVCHLSAALKKPQPYVSQQLAILRKAGVIVDHKEGNNVFYGLVNGPIAHQVSAILGATFAEDPTNARAVRQRVAGCFCPKCEPGGTCEPRRVASTSPDATVQA